MIVAVQAERATGSEADCLSDLVTRARFAGHAVAELAADSGYASQDAYAALDELGTVALIPPQPGAKHDAAADGASERMRTATGRDAAFDRQAHAEGAIAELKRHGADRARCRGTRLVQLQLLAAATAINLKRLLKADDAADGEQTGDPATSAATIPRSPSSPAHRLPHALDEIGRLAAADRFNRLLVEPSASTARNSRTPRRPWRRPRSVMWLGHISLTASWPRTTIRARLPPRTYGRIH